MATTRWGCCSGTGLSLMQGYRLLPSTAAKSTRPSPATLQVQRKCPWRQATGNVASNLGAAQVQRQCRPLEAPLPEATMSWRPSPSVSA